MRSRFSLGELARLNSVIAITQAITAARVTDFDQLRTSLVSFSQATEKKPVTFDIVRHVGPLLDPVAVQAANAMGWTLDMWEQRHKSPYHNLLHILNVSLTAFCLGLTERASPSSFFKKYGGALSKEEASDLFVLGLMHDIGHPGGTNGGVPFGLEKQSWMIAEPHLKKAGYEGARLERMRMMLLATDPSYGVPIINHLMRVHSASEGRLHDLAFMNFTRSLGKMKSEEATALARFFRNDKRTTGLSYLFNKSDLAESLMPETAPKRVRDLNREYATRHVPVSLIDEQGRPDAEKAIFFFDQIVGFKGKFLLDNVQEVLGAAAEETFAAMTDPKRAFRAPRQEPRVPKT